MWRQNREQRSESEERVEVADVDVGRVKPRVRVEFACGGCWTEMFRIAVLYVLLTTLLMERKAGGSVQKIRIARCVCMYL